MTKKINIDRFKFRVWQPNLKHIDSDKIGRMCYLENESCGYDLPAICEDVKAGNCIIMQSTGLYDKNEKLIYDGDVLKEITQRGDVSYTGKQCGIWQQNGHHIQALKINYSNRGFCLQFNLNSSPKECEIIGNIYENPELLANF